MDDTPFKIFFCINGIETYTQSENQGVVNYIGLHVWTMALRGIYHGDKIGIFGISDGYLHSKIHSLTIVLLYAAVLGTAFLFGLILPWSCLLTFHIYWVLSMHICVCK